MRSSKLSFEGKSDKQFYTMSTNSLRTLDEATVSLQQNLRRHGHLV